MFEAKKNFALLKYKFHFIVKLIASIMIAPSLILYFEPILYMVHFVSTILLLLFLRKTNSIL